MLTETSFNTATPLANALTRQGIALTALDTSPLAALVGASLPTVQLVAADGGAVAESPRVVIEAATSLEAYEGVSDHQALLNQVTQDAVASVSAVFELARGTVVPQIARVVEQATAYADSRRTRSEAKLVTRRQHMSSLEREPLYQDLLSGFNNVTFRNVDPMVLTCQWAPDVLDVGIPDLSNAIADFISQGGDRVKDTWERYFSNVPGKYRQADASGDFEDPLVATVVFLGATHLVGQAAPPKGLTCSLGEYTAYVARLMELAGAHLCYGLKNRRASIEAQQLVVRAPAKQSANDVPSGEVLVQEEVLTRFFKDGGSVDGILGAVARGGDLSYAGLLANEADNASFWKSYIASQRQQDSYHYQADLIAGLRTALVALATTLNTSGEGFNARFYEILDERMQKVILGTPERLYYAARKAVCLLFYPDSDVLEVLKMIDHMVEVNPSLKDNVRGAALLAMVEYAGQWVSGMIVSNRVVPA